MSPQPRLRLGCGDIWESVVSQQWPQTRYQFLQPWPNPCLVIARAHSITYRYGCKNKDSLCNSRNKGVPERSNIWLEDLTTNGEANRSMNCLFVCLFVCLRVYLFVCFVLFVCFCLFFWGFLFVCFFWGGIVGGSLFVFQPLESFQEISQYLH